MEEISKFDMGENGTSIYTTSTKLAPSLRPRCPTSFCFLANGNAGASMFARLSVIKPYNTKCQRLNISQPKAERMGERCFLSFK